MFDNDIIPVAFLAISCLIFSATRYFFKPSSNISEEQMEYMYPARKIATLLYLQGLFLTAYIFKPENPSSQMLRDVFLPLFLPYDIAMLISTYFGKVLNWTFNKKIDIALFMTVPLILMMLFISGLFFPQLLDQQALKVVKIAALSMAVAWTLLLVVLDRKIRNCLNTCSDCDKKKFPRLFARRVVLMIVPAVLIAWLGYFFDCLRSVAYIVLGLETVLLMIIILPTQRNLQSETAVVEQLTKSVCCKNNDYIAEKIRNYVEGNKAFLNPKLTIADIAVGTNISRTYISKVIKDDFGGFYKYVNCLRFQYLENFRKENPNISLDAAVEQCGFVSRNAYYNARKYVK